jgi:hypothetical protein
VSKFWSIPIERRGFGDRTNMAAVTSASLSPPWSPAKNKKQTKIIIQAIIT